MTQKVIARKSFLSKEKIRFPRRPKKIKYHSVIKDLVINKEEPIFKVDNQDTWDFAEAEEFFK